MTEQIKINIGANASQAIAEMGKVRNAAGGLKQTFGGVRMGLGVVTAFTGVNIIREFMEPLKQGFLEVTQSSADFNAVIQMTTEGLVDLGRKIGELVVPVIEAFGELMAKVVEFFSGRFAGLAFRAGFAQLKAGPDLLTGRQFTSAASEQFAPDVKKRQEEMVKYTRETAMTLMRMERDMATQQWTDPW